MVAVLGEIEGDKEEMQKMADLKIRN